MKNLLRLPLPNALTTTTVQQRLLLASAFVAAGCKLIRHGLRKDVH